MSFHEDFLRELRADLAQVLRLPAEAIYVGREPQRVTRQGLEVLIRPGDMDYALSLRIRRYELRVRNKAGREGDQTGAVQVTPVVNALDAIVARYDGQRPFARALPALLAVEVDDLHVDNDPDEQELLEGRVTLRVGEQT